MVVATLNIATLYPLNWPTNPFHMGEVEVQNRLGVQEHVMGYAPKVVRPYMPDQHREFYMSQPFLVVAARDEESNRMWSSLLFASDSDRVTSFITSPDPTRLSMDARVLPGDALENALLPGSDLGMLGIEFAARRRNRVNGRIVAVSDENMTRSLEFKVDQSYGNCPQYIKPRDWWTTTKETTNNESETVEKQSPLGERSNQLSKAQIDNIRQAETIFVATGYRGEGDDPRFGNDASHRGGAPGFIKVEGSNKLLLPDYSGNNHYNTIGNLVMDSRMGITIPLFDCGGMIQLSGRAVVDWDAAAAAKFLGAERVIEFTIDEIVELPPGSLPIQWASRDKNQLQVQVLEKVRESQDVTSFYLSAVPGDAPSLPLFLPGQHLPITLSTGNSEVVARTYSLSSSNLTSDRYYRISVKRNPFGIASRYLHDEVHAGDVLSIQKPAGDFVYDQGSDRTLVLLSAGIGITPMLSMLHKFVEQVPASTKQAYWIHSARDAKHHPFRDEVAGLQRIAGDRLRSHVAFTKPSVGDTGYDSVGRITIDLLKDFVVDLKNVDVYMCGTDSFMANIGSSLEGEGVDQNHIHFESF
jgi:ferredoxin-NADP reductase/predicted pyridoxine 5'-phosphate oxidase superfamily flavin-nucleotide-binding protein